MIKRYIVMNGVLILSLTVTLGWRPVVTYAKSEETKTTNKKENMSLDLKGVDILELFKMLSQKSGLTIITSKNVSGRINIFLNNLTFEDALDVILINQNLASEKKGNIITIMTAAEYEALFGRKFIEKRKYKSLKLKYAKPGNVASILGQIKSDVGKIIVDEASGVIVLIDIPEKLDLMEATIIQMDQPLETEIFEFNYAKAKDSKSFLESLVTPGLGSVMVDERSNKAIVSDLPDRVSKIRAVVKAFDEESRQVLIECQIIQITLNNKFQSGIDWERILSENKWHGLDLKSTYPIDSTLTTYSKINIGTLTTDDYNVVLTFLQDYGNTRILSRPQILAVNNQEAKILVGTRDAYITQTTSQSTNTVQVADQVQFVDVGVKLNVTPTIGKDGFITMKIKTEVSSSEALTINSNRIPIVSTSESDTVVKIKDGVMVMIAGLMKEEKSETIHGIPVLSRLPLLGGLFGSRVSQNPKRTELVIFLTPHLISGDMPAEKIEAIGKVVENIPAKLKSKETSQAETKKAEKKSTVALDISSKLKGIKQ
ncbi:MAG: secretin and TonB N-terminal domain-containing protein [Candidatus Omnitrophica bacterium]|nr:secretin and TonB N-terminal domain-containing protein [Candidatus Omnitrophota bacterium]